MTILYLSYWNLVDPLTRSTVFPNLKQLQNLDFVSKIIFVNVERIEEANEVFYGFENRKIVYKPLTSSKTGWNYLAKILDFIFTPRRLSEIIESQRVDCIIARGAPAGALAYLSTRSRRIPFFVESFEPHAEYMRESKVWGRFDLRYRFQRRWEQKQKKLASGLMPVAETYRYKLLLEGISTERLRTVPCSVDLDKFSFSKLQRSVLRNQFRIEQQTIVGIYAGKFGGLYLEHEAFELYKIVFSLFSDFYLVLLSPEDQHDWIKAQMGKYGLPSGRVMVASVDHDRVPNYLSMADFAFATYRSGANKAFLSPVKVGEYWASGLPVVLTSGVGDETEIIKNSKFAGVLFDPRQINHIDTVNILEDLRKMLDIDRRQALADIARHKRSADTVRQAYEYFLRKYALQTIS